MWRLFLIALLLLATFVVAPYLTADNSSVTLTWADTTYTVSAFVALLCLIAFLATLYFVEFLVRFILKGVFGWWFNRKLRREEKSVKLAEQGLRTEVAGNYRRAQRYLQRSAKYAKDPIFALTQTFELALRNKDLIGAKHALTQAAGLAQPADQNIIDVCRLKYFVKTQDWKPAYEHIFDVLRTVNTEEVNLLALQVFEANEQYSYLEDQVERTLKLGYINQQQANSYYNIIGKGLIEQQLATNGNDVTKLLDWFNKQARVRTRNVFYRCQILNKLHELQKVNEEAEFAAETMYLCKAQDLEQSNFVDLVSRVQLDTEYRLLTKAIERKLNSYSPDNQEKLIQTLITLLYTEGNMLNAKLWLNKLLGSDVSSSLINNPSSLLLAQAIYRKLGDQNKLGEVNNIIEHGYLPESKAAKQAIEEVELARQKELEEARKEQLDKLAKQSPAK